MAQRYDVIVVGAGVIGLACAWRIARSGRSVVVVDPAPGAGATWTAAGMLAPVTEFGYGEQALLALNLASARLYPQFVAELERVTGCPVGYERRGTLQVAWDSADLATLRDVHNQHVEYGLPAEMMTGRELHRFEPALASGLPGAVYAPDDHQIDNRALHQALLAAVRSAGVELLTRSVRRIDSDGDRVTGVSLAEDGNQICAEWVVVAAGAHTRHIQGLPDGVATSVRPVKGQTIRLTGDAALLTHVVRGSVKGSPVYIVPRASGEIVVGASSEDVGFDTRPRVGAVYELLRDAFALLPGLAEWTWAEVSTGLRPGTPDNAPMVGATSIPGLVIASGHYRNGMLLAPITADAVAAEIDDRPPPFELAGFSPLRFAPTPAMKEGSR
ncbi:MAG: glycine oxidase ThiO [Pseudonocardiales bacterium]|nr:glycine oxidase ThiO [Pseudonocardiales bacterium]